MQREKSIGWPLYLHNEGFICMCRPVLICGARTAESHFNFSLNYRNAGKGKLLMRLIVPVCLLSVEQFQVNCKSMLKQLIESSQRLGD